MNQTFKITGMSCQGCRKQVEEILKAVDGVNQVSVDLEKEQARLSSDAAIGLSKLQEALTAAGGNYGIEE